MREYDRRIQKPAGAIKAANGKVIQDRRIVSFEAKITKKVAMSGTGLGKILMLIPFAVSSPQFRCFVHSFALIADP
jgi:hypothetical protein